jgi:hypothetical protein
VQGFDVDWERVFGPEVLEEDDWEAEGRDQAPSVWRDALEED